jgi:sulfur-oxidizing protein SoxY
MRLIKAVLPALLYGAAITLAAPAGAGSASDRTAAQPSPVWVEIRQSLYDDRAVQDGSALISLETPYRAHDAAIVPVAIEVDPGPWRRVVRLTLIIDENPAPVAAEFEIGEGMGHTVALSTRVRVNAYSNVRVVAELDDGTLHQFARFVKATGGCSAPALKDMDAAIAVLGQMKLRQFMLEAGARGPAGTWREAQVMVRHPNNSGFQMDQVTRLHIPAFFVHEMEVRQGAELLFRMSGGISLSEDPSIRFRYVPNGSPALEVRALDTDGGDFRKSFPVATGS